MKPAVFTMKLDAELRAEFVAEAAATHRPASQVVRDLMRDFVREQRQRRDHAAFLNKKVELARASVRDGCGRSNETVEADFEARRTRLTDCA